MSRACTWKCALKLAHRASTKEDSGAMANVVFPEVGDELLKLKMHHGRVEALLIAVHGHWAERVGTIINARTTSDH